MLTAFSAQRPSVELIDPPQNEIQMCYQGVFYDHPELFWISHAPSASGSQGRFGVKITFTAPNIYSSAEIQQAQQVIHGIKNALKPLLSGKRDDEKEKIVCDFLLRTVEYEINNTYNQDASSALVHQKAQCTGIAKAVKLLFDWIGMDCILVEGEVEDPSTGNRGPHAWNMLRVDGEWYHLDVTMMMGANTTKREPFRYMYFNKTDMDLRGMYFWRGRDYPRCTASYGGDPLSMPNTPPIVPQASSGQNTPAPQPQSTSNMPQNRQTQTPAPSNGGRRAWGMPRPTPSTPSRPSGGGFPFFGRKANANAQNAMPKQASQMPAYNPGGAPPRGTATPSGNMPYRPTTQNTPPKPQHKGPKIRTVAELRQELAKVYGAQGTVFEFHSKLPMGDPQQHLDTILQAACDEAAACGVGAEVRATIRDGEDVVINITYTRLNSTQHAHGTQKQPIQRKNLPTISTVSEYRQAVAKLVPARKEKLEFYLASPLKDSPRLVNVLLQNAGMETQKCGQAVYINVEIADDEAVLELEWQ